MSAGATVVADRALLRRVADRLEEDCRTLAHTSRAPGGRWRCQHAREIHQEEMEMVRGLRDLAKRLLGPELH